MAPPSRTQNDLNSLSDHPIYNIPTGDLHLLVGNVHFRIHSYFFTRESSKFRDSLSVPATPGGGRKGTSPSNALVVENTSPEDFARFLWVFYDPHYSRSTTVEHWIIILDLAHRWIFPEIKSLAIHALEELTVPLVERIGLYQKYQVPEDIVHPHYAALCARPQILTVSEIELLGTTTSVMIFSVREKVLASQASVRQVNQFETNALQKLVGSYFKPQQNREKDKKEGETPKGDKNSEQKKGDTKKGNGHS
ncbi:hypothetical protein AX17_006120 [Amanita inopinata Kibby_2008]|nr:hypothetical protein AX17_006120 [Amanita inopinata Kibby_2008]